MAPHSAPEDAPPAREAGDGGRAQAPAHQTSTEAPPQVAADAQTQSTRTVRGRVKWFDRVRGYGFVEITDQAPHQPDDAPRETQGAAAPGASGSAGRGADVLIHAACLRRSGHSAPPDGADVVCEVAQRQNGLQAVRVLELIAPQTRPSTALRGARSRGATTGERTSPRPPALDTASAALIAPDAPGVVKWFNRAQGYGFLTVEGVVADVFVHMDVVRQGGLPGLTPGERVRARVVAGVKGPVAAALTRETIASPGGES